MEARNLLDQLRPNHIPDPVGWWPPATGWWILAALAIILLATLTGYGYQYWKKNRYRTLALKQASKTLTEYQEHRSAHQFAHDCNELLKRVALHAFPKSRVASLNGSLWCEFLAESAGISDFLNHNAFNNNRYNPNASLPTEDIYELTRRWIKRHHA